jgi:hypothetical protein
MKHSKAMSLTGNNLDLDGPFAGLGVGGEVGEEAAVKENP